MSEPSYLTLHELVKKARQNLNHNAWDYLVGGTETETTQRRNRLALDTQAFRPRVLRDVSAVDASTEFLGRQMRLPVVLAPVGSLELFDAKAGGAAAGAAGDFGCAHMLSSVSELSVEDVAQAAPNAYRMFQLYVNGDAAWIDDVFDRVIASGYSAIAITVDSSVYSRRERDVAKRNLRRVTVPGREYQATFTWTDVQRLRAKYNMPLMLKGINTAEDARMAVEHGVDVVYVSNHGGRQLDHGQGSLDVLPEVVEAVAGRAKIVVDGGFFRGTDIVKAMALGAHLVGLGRLQCMGLAAGGQAGLVRVLELLEREVRDCLALLGVNNWQELNPNYLRSAPAVESPSALSAFPLLDLSERSFY
jgi:isopentenyl diphosphate isomerase/L-lactate dehydrogenase-like FMN-dependent dehydrogenase